MRNFGWVCIMVFTVMMCSACSGKAPKCTDFNTASTTMAQTLEQFAIVLEQTPDTTQAVAKIRAMLDERNAALEPCMQIVSRTIQAMDPQQILTIHEKYIADPRVRRFLDAQDKFQESATSDQIELLDELVGQLYITAE